MLPLGRLGLRAERGEPRDDGFTPAERMSLLTLWVMARSPRFVGGDLPTTAPETIALLTNADILEVHERATASREVLREGPLVLWTADGHDSLRRAAAFNLGDTPLNAVLDAGEPRPPRRPRRRGTRAVDQRRHPAPTRHAAEQRCPRAFREYLTGLLAPRDRNKTLTGLAGSEPVTGAQHAAVQRVAVLPVAVHMGC